MALKKVTSNPVTSMRHMGRVQAFMNISSSIDDFKITFKKNTKVISIAPDLFNSRGIIKSDSEL